MGEEVIPVIYRAVDDLRKRGGLAVWIVTPTYQWIVNRLAALADVHLKLQESMDASYYTGLSPEPHSTPSNQTQQAKYRYQVSYQ